MKKIILMLCLLAVSVTMYGCTSKEIHKDSGLMKITDDNGRQVAFSKKPERIVVLSPSFLELLEVLDGNVVGRAESTIVRTSDFAKNAAVVGFIFNINTEKVVELKPDLIVAYKGMHEKYIQLFEANGIPVVVLNLKTYEDVKHSIKILGELTGQKEKGLKIASELDKKVQNTLPEFLLSRLQSPRSESYGPLQPLCWPPSAFPALPPHQRYSGRPGPAWPVHARLPHA